MPCHQPRSKRVEALARRFDQQHLLGVEFDATLPAIDRIDARDDVDACGEAFLDQLARERRHVECSADGGEDEERRQRCSARSMSRAVSCASLRMAPRYCDHSKNGSVMAAHTGRVPTRMAVG